MSDPISKAAEVADIDVSKAQSNAVAAADEHTPETPEHKAVSANIPDPVAGDSAVSELADLTKTLAQRIEELEGAVLEIAAKADPDVPPVKRVPWTKRGGRR